MNKMNFCFAINEGYVDYCRVAMVSILENNQADGTKFHILTDVLSDAARKRLIETAAAYGSVVKIYEMDDSRLVGQKTTWSKYAWYRIFASDVISHDVDKLLYLDCDVVVTGDISQLFTIDMTDKSVAGVTDVMAINADLYDRVGYSHQKGYFCTGVLMMNLAYFREHDLGKRILNFAVRNPEKIQFPDQDALNCVCCDTKVTLPLKYGVLAPFFTNQDFIKEYCDEVADALNDPRIVHYAGCAPWIKEYSSHLLEYEFWKYADLVGGIEVQRRITGLALVKHRIKELLGIIGVPAFRRFVKPHRPTRKDVECLISQISREK